MNNTKSSRLSIKTIKPANFRVFLKQRNNHHEVSKPLPTQKHLADNTPKEQPPPDLALKSESISKMKDFVRSRIKTDNATDSQSRLHGKESASQRGTLMNVTAIDKFRTNHKDPTGSSFSDFKVQLSSSQEKLQERGKPRLSSLKSLQQKAEGLLMQKLHHCSKSKGMANRELQEEVRELIREIREVGVNPEGDSSSAVSLINSKILLFEKMMAENMAEGEIMRKHLLSRIANKAKSRRLKTDANVSNSQYSYRDSDFCRQVVVNTSMNQESFRQPAPPAYHIYRHRQEHFNADRHRQPLPRSSYNRDFLLYDQVAESGIFPTGNVIMGRSSSANSFRSSYRDSFGPKRTSRINIRELDACKDKIKNIDIDFGRKSRAVSGMLRYDICRGEGGQWREGKRYESPSMRVAGKYLLTESRRQFGQNLPPSQSAIKHENLQNLRYQYKNIMHA